MIIQEEVLFPTRLAGMDFITKWITVSEIYKLIGKSWFIKKNIN